MKNYLLPYECKKFSQHGEDGIIDTLLKHIVKKDYTFLEIGFGNGKVTNMSKNLLFNHNYTGIGVDMADAVYGYENTNLTYVQSKVDIQNCLDLINEKNMYCDFFSLDIDSYDFDILQKLFESGFCPKIICVEINRGFGKSVASFPFKEDAKRLYNKSYFHGCSLNKYKKYLSKKGYNFFTLDSSGVNAFFYNKKSCNVEALQSYDVLENSRIEDKVKKVLSNEIEIKKDFYLRDYWKELIHEIYKE